MAPDDLITPEIEVVVEMFYVWRGGMNGNGPLPFAGGYAQQPALLMGCFRLMSAAVSALAERTDG